MCTTFVITGNRVARLSDGTSRRESSVYDLSLDDKDILAVARYNEMTVNFYQLQRGAKLIH